MYVTEAAARIGQLMMEDLVNMHKEFRQFYGPEASDGPEWMKWDEIEMLPLELKQILCGSDGMKFGAWMPLYRYRRIAMLFVLPFYFTFTLSSLVSFFVLLAPM